MIIFNISGKAESGKNLMCDIIDKYYKGKNKKVCHLLFANRIKTYAKDHFGWDGREDTKEIN
jgi:hypothetical protein